MVLEWILTEALEGNASHERSTIAELMVGFETVKQKLH